MMALLSYFCKALTSNTSLACSLLLKRSVWFSIFSFLFSLLVSCTGTNLAPYYNTEGLALGTYIPLQEGMNPQVVEVNDLSGALARYKAQGYVVLGSLSYNGTRLPQNEIAKFAKEKKASIVLYKSSQTGTAERVYAIPVTHSSTSYTSGNIHSTGFMQPYSSYNYQGTTTTTSTEWQQRSYTVGLYDNSCVFLAKEANPATL